MPISVVFLICFAGISLVGGVLFVVNNLRSAQDDEMAVPISNLEEIREIKTNFNENIVGKKQPVSLADHVIKQNLESKNNVVLNDDSQNKALIAENSRLSDALNRELSSKDAVTLSEQRRSEREEAKKRLVQMQDSQDNLTKENQTLNQKLEEKSVKLDEAKNYINQITKRVEEASNLSDEKISLYEQEIVEIRKENEKLLKANEVFDSLQKENESLKNHDDVISIRLKRMAQKIIVLKQKNRHFSNERLLPKDKMDKENQELIRRMKLSEEKVYELQENIEIVNRRNEQKLNEAQGQIDLLKSQLEDFQAIKEPFEDRPLDNQEVLLEEECNRLVQEKEDSVRNFQKIKEFNEHLLEKEKILQYELTKARAQNLGLEKICEEFKDQIEKTDKISS